MEAGECGWTAASATRSSFVKFREWTGERTVATLGHNAGSIELPFQGWRRFKQAFAERQPRGIIFSQGLIGMLRRREVEALGERLAAETGQTFNQATSGEYVAGAYRQRFALASGRFAMIDDGLGFQLVPWTPSLEK